VIVMRRLGVIVALGAMLGMLGGLLTAAPALAGRGPKWQIVPARPFTLPAEFCGFKVRVAFLGNQYSKVLKSSNGTVITLATGATRISYTNQNTGKTITPNVSGPGKTTVYPDGSTLFALKGHSGVTLPPDLAQQLGLPTVSVTAGALTARFDPDGNPTISLHGHVLIDVCAALS
jgi:hypothetical protein